MHDEIQKSTSLIPITDAEKQPGIDCLHMCGEKTQFVGYRSDFYECSPDSFSAICTTH